jgi:hypothetical protein
MAHSGGSCSVQNFSLLAVAVLNRRLLGTHQGGVTMEHLDAYLDKFTFAGSTGANRAAGGRLFYCLLEQAVAVGRFHTNLWSNALHSRNSEKPQDVAVICEK